jgi:hypothetical protein
MDRSIDQAARRDAQSDARIAIGLAAGVGGCPWGETQDHAWLRATHGVGQMDYGDGDESRWSYTAHMVQCPSWSVPVQ